MEDRVKAILADMLGLPVSSIHDGTSMETVEKWDSLLQINLVAALEEEFGVTFDVDEFETMTSYADIIDVLAQKI